MSYFFHLTSSTLQHVAGRVSFETSFDSKQPKLEPKLVSALFETKRLFGLFRFYTQTESFDVSIEPKQTEDQPKQFYREHILLFCQHCFICRSSDSAVSEDAGTKLRTVATLAFAFRRSNHLARSRVSSFFGFCRVFSFFSFFQFVSVVSLLYRNREFRLNRNKQKTHPNSLKDSIYGNFSENLGLFRFVSVSYETDLFVSVVSIKV
jgi:hypothetical protein